MSDYARYAEGLDRGHEKSPCELGRSTVERAPCIPSWREDPTEVGPATFQLHL